MVGWSLGSATTFTSVGMIPRPKKLIRPPGAQKEEIFLSMCLRCQQCIEACPLDALTTAHLQEGILASGTPILFSECVLCMKCTEACPSGALDKKLSKKEVKMGRAEVIIDECIGCGKCVPACKFKALSFNKEEKEVKVDASLCRGCFACVSTCPVEPKGIRVVPI